MIHLKKTCPALLALAFLFCCATPVKADDTAADKSPTAFTVNVTGTGRPMILIPGLSCGGDVWDATVAHFKDHYECHVLTLAGFAGQPAIGAPFLKKVRTDLEKYIADKKLDHPVIIGHSLGGFMAFWVGSSIPNQVGPIIAVDGLPFLAAIYNPGATEDSVKDFASQYQTMFSSKSAEEFAASNRKMLAAMITAPKDLDAVDATSKNSDPKAVGQAFYDLMTHDLRQKVKAISSPVLLLGETGDETDPQKKAQIQAAYRQQVALIPNHKVVFAPKSRHFIQLDAPQFFYAQVESFLKTADAANAK